MKNVHGVEPTWYRKRKGNIWTNDCDPKYGPLFGNNAPDICISDNCNEENSCWITKLSTMQYECHPKYKSSLYKINKTDKLNSFLVSVMKNTHNNISLVCLQQNNLSS